MIELLKRGIQVLGNGAPGPLRGDKTGALVVTDGHARYHEAVLSGRVWIASNPAGTAVTTQAGLSATTPAFTLYNPVNSPVNLVLWSVGAAIQASPAAAAAVELAYNFVGITGVVKAPFTVTNANYTNALLSLGQQQSATGVSNLGAWGAAYVVATLIAAPIAFRQCFGTTGASGIGGMSFRDHIDGGVIIPPGVAISVQASSAASVVCDMEWEEDPISN